MLEVRFEKMEWLRSGTASLPKLVWRDGPHPWLLPEFQSDDSMLACLHANAKSQSRCVVNCLS